LQGEIHDSSEGKPTWALLVCQHESRRRKEPPEFCIAKLEVRQIKP
jgi:hypothetical protein